MNKTIKNNDNPIVFLPGWSFGASIWHTTGIKLKNQNVVYCDLPHLNQTHTCNNNQLEVISDSLAHKIPVNSVIVAWSLGGLIAIDLCHKFPDIYKKLILVASTPNFSTITEDFMANAKTDITTTINKFLCLTQYPNHNPIIRKELKNHLLDIASERNSLLGYLELLQKTDLSPIINKLSKPTLHIHGNQDVIAPVTPQSNHNDNTKIIQDAGHIPFLTHDEIFINILQKSIAS
jgi:pimeloyl-[acyl-carrier protein] methyl ester esterase